MTASATGSFTADTVGSYTLTAMATDAAGNTGDATADFTVNYAISWLSPLSLGKTAKGGSTIPIKFTVRDCNDKFVHDESVLVKVVETSADDTPIVFEGLFGMGSVHVRIDDTEKHYIINFQTAPGQHIYRADVYFSGDDGYSYLQASKAFSVR